MSAPSMGFLVLLASNSFEHHYISLYEIFLMLSCTRSVALLLQPHEVFLCPIEFPDTGRAPRGPTHACGHSTTSCVVQARFQK